MYIHKTINCVHETRSKLSSNETQHSAICYAQNQSAIKHIAADFLGNSAL